MDDRSEQRVLEKAEYVSEAVSILAKKRDTLSFEEYAEEREQRDVVEREFQTAIEACIDIGELLLASSGTEIPDTNAGVFRELGADTLIETTVATRMAEAAGFRNVLAHRYGNEIDDEDVYNYLQHELPLFRDFLREVRSILD